MDEMLTPKQKSAIQRAKLTPDLQGILFRKATGVHWFPAFIEAGFLNPADIPPPVPAKEEGYVSIPAWPITEYLVATSEELRDPLNEEYAVQVLDFIRAATISSTERGFGNYRVWWQFSKIICNIPVHLISLDDIALIDTWLDDRFERGLVAETLGCKWLLSLLSLNDAHSKSLSISLLDVLFKINSGGESNVSSSKKKAALRFDSWYAKKIIEKVACKAGSVLRRDAVHIFQVRLETILDMDDNDKWSCIWRSAIENHDQNHGADDTEDIIVEAFRDSLLAYIEAAPDSSLKYVEELLGNKFETIKRVAIYAIDQQFRFLSNYADHVISREYFNSNFRHELWHFLRNHYKELGQDQKKCVLSIVNDLIETDENGHINEGATAYQQAIWFSAIKDIDEETAQHYRKNIEKAGVEPKNPDFSSYMTVGNVDDKSPIPVEELLSLEIDDLLKQLLSAKDQGSFKEPSFRGLVKALQQAIKAEPLRYHALLHKFTATDLPFVNSIIEAYQELWAEKAQLPWDEIWDSLLKFCRDIVNQDRFWASENAKERSSFVANRYWVVGAMGRLIESGTKSDDHAFSEKLLDEAENVLLILLDKENGEEFRVDTDAVSLAINSPRGRCIEALINLTLRSCRLSDKKSGNHVEVWKHFQPVYDVELRRSEIGEYEFATLVSNYLPNFMYMSNDWVLENLDRIFDQSIYQKWLCAMQGYAYVGSVYEGIYRHLKERGHLIKALDDENIKKRVNEKVIQNIAVAFLNNFETLDDGLIKQILQRGQQSELSHMIWFFWTLRKDGDDNIKAKVFALWPLILEVIDTSSREGRLLASKLCDWAAFVDEVTDENKKLILAVAPFAEEGHNSYDLLRSIAKISERHPIDAYEIWLRLLEGAKPDFPEEAIREALANFMRIGHDGQRMAKDIVSAYIRGGNEQPSKWLRDIVESEKNLTSLE